MAGASFGSKFGSWEERQRLAQLYAAMCDGELRELAREAESLTDEARRALASEMERREIAPDEPDEPGDAEDSGEAILPEAEFRDLLTIRQYRDVPEALLAKSVLESAGIECFLGDVNLIRMDWLWSNLLGGIKLRVRQEDAVVASRLLEGDRSRKALHDKRGDKNNVTDSTRDVSRSADDDGDEGEEPES